MIRISVWTAIFLVVLRVCIGWHFAYEGYGKVRSAYEGKAAVNDKPFSSEAFFRESESPVGRMIKSQLGDPTQEVVDKLTLAADGQPAERFPAALAREWDDYFDRYVAQFKLDEAQQIEPRKQFVKSKVAYVHWVEGIVEEVDPETKKTKQKPVRLTVKRKAPGANPGGDFEDEVTPSERAAELKEKAEEVREAYAKMDQLGRDVEGAHLRAKKAEVNAIRIELQKEIDKHTEAMKDGLARLFDTRVTAFAEKAGEMSEEATLNAMLTPMRQGSNPLAAMWDGYAAFVKDYAPNLTEGHRAQVDAELAAAKVRFDRWLADQDPYTGQPEPNSPVAEWRKRYADAQPRQDALRRVLPESKKIESKEKGKTAPAPTLPIVPGYVTDALVRMKTDAEAEVKALTSRMQRELKSQSDAMRALVGKPLLGEDRAKGHAAPSDERHYLVVPKDWTLIDVIDWTTRWFLLVVGILLMIGLFTRLSCFAAAGFLLVTILVQPSVPWLPAPPVSEGNYLFVNKNVIEMVALIALMTTRSGQWAGLDAIVRGLLSRRRPTGK
jgi:uncharacterized membrane protein YphA (DoxX/SURF4 family)